MKQISYLKYLVFPIVVGLVLFAGSLLWDEFKKPSMEIKTTSISDFDLEVDFFESLKNYPVKVTVQNVGQKTAEEVNIHLEFDQEILGITKIKTTIEIDLWKIKFANKQLDIVTDGEYFMANNIDGQISKNINLSFEKVRASEQFQFIVLTKHPATIKKCEFLLENSKGGNCMIEEKENGLLNEIIYGFVLVILTAFMLISLMQEIMETRRRKGIRQDIKLAIKETVDHLDEK